MFSQRLLEVQATSPWYPDAIMGTFAAALWTPETLAAIGARHSAPFSKGFIDGVEQRLLLLLVTDHEWPLVCLPKPIGYVAAIQLGDHFDGALHWLRNDIERIRISLPGSHMGPT